MAFLCPNVFRVKFKLTREALRELLRTGRLTGSRVQPRGTECAQHTLPCSFFSMPGPSALGASPLANPLPQTSRPRQPAFLPGPLLRCTWSERSISAGPFHPVTARPSPPGCTSPLECRGKHTQHFKDKTDHYNMIQMMPIQVRASKNCISPNHIIPQYKQHKFLKPTTVIWEELSLKGQSFFSKNK